MGHAMIIRLVVGHVKVSISKKLNLKLVPMVRPAPCEVVSCHYCDSAHEWLKEQQNACAI